MWDKLMDEGWGSFEIVIVYMGGGGWSRIVSSRLR